MVVAKTKSDQGNCIIQGNHLIKERSHRTSGPVIAGQPSVSGRCSCGGDCTKSKARRKSVHKQEQCQGHQQHRPAGFHDGDNDRRRPDFP